MSTEKKIHPRRSQTVRACDERNHKQIPRNHAPYILALVCNLLLILGLTTMAAAQSGNITTIAGTGAAGFSGDGGAATIAKINSPRGLFVDGSGNLYIADRLNHRVRKVDTDGNITTVAGTGVAGFSGDGGPATAAKLREPTGMAMDAAGNLYIADAENNRIRKVDTGGIITTVAGTGVQGYSGDGGPATAAKLSCANEVFVDGAGNLYISDECNHRIRKVDTGGIITTVAGTGVAGYSGDGGPAIAAKLREPADVIMDGSGNLYIADWLNHRVRKVDTGGIITTVVGTGVAGFSGDGGPATSAKLNGPLRVAVDGAGNLYIADSENNRTRKVDTGGIITTVAGTGVAGFSGDGGLATAAKLNSPNGVALDGSDNLYIADRDNHRIRKVFPSLTLGGSISGAVLDEAMLQVPGALVQICQVGGGCMTVVADGSGQYSAAGLAAGQYNLTAFPPAGVSLVPNTIGPLTLSAGQSLTGQDIHLARVQAMPEGTTITGRIGRSGIPMMFWGRPLTLTTRGCMGGSARYEIVRPSGLVRSGDMTEAPAGTYTATIPPLAPIHGYAIVQIFIVCPDFTVETRTFTIYIDPSGHVLTGSGDPIEGATVTLYRSDTPDGPFTVVPDGSAIMSPANRTNPDVTDASGHFGWDVIAGYYIVRAEGPGCVSPDNPSQPFVETGVLTIPPPVTDLVLRLDCNEAPVAEPGPDQTVECTGPAGAVVSLDGTASSDPDGDPITFAWSASGIIFDNPNSSTPIATFPMGEHTVTLVVNDGMMDSAPETVIIKVQDTTPPMLSVPATPVSLWPPNHQYETITVAQCVISVQDNCASLSASDVVITKVTSDEEEDAKGGGDGNTVDDIVIAPDCQSVQLRSERQGSGNGRVYTIHFSVNDGNGNVATATYRVTVPKSQNGNPAIDDGPAYTENSRCTGSSAKITGASSVESSAAMALPENYALEPNHPNPFNPSTMISFALPEGGNVTLRVFNTIGQLVTTLVDGEIAAGRQVVRWDGRNQSGHVVAAGVYFYQLVVKSQSGQAAFSETRRMTLAK